MKRLSGQVTYWLKQKQKVLFFLSVLVMQKLRISSIVGGFKLCVLLPRWWDQICWGPQRCCQSSAVSAFLWISCRVVWHRGLDVVVSGGVFVDIVNWQRWFHQHSHQSTQQWCVDTVPLSGLTSWTLDTWQLGMSVLCGIFNKNMRTT